jgi:hypothetical protein
MAKALKDILDGIKTSKITPGSIGVDPDVDYAPKNGDDRRWVNTHSIEAHSDRVGNDDKLYSASNITPSMNTKQMERFGHKKGEDKKVYEGIVNEKLTASMSVGDFIDDFVKSDEPKFKGKSSSERRQMALGAYYKMHPTKSSRTNEDLAIPKEKTDDTEEEISMVKGELKAIANKSAHILMSMSKDMHVEPWVQAKIAQAKELINSVHDYLLYNQEDEQTDGQINFPGMDGNNIGPPSTFPGGGATYNAIGMNV